MYSIVKTNNNRNDYSTGTGEDYSQSVSYSHLVEDSQSVLYSHSVTYNQTEGSNNLVENNYSVNYSHLVEDNDLIERKEILVIEGTGEILQDISSTGRIRNWSEKKEMNLELVEIFEYARTKDSSIITNSRLNQLKECGSYLKYADTTEGRKLREANFCRVRLCPLCQWRRSLKLFSQVSEITDYILQHKKVRFIFATFTLKNVSGEDLSSTIDRMNEGFKFLVQKKINLAETKPLQENLIGYLKAIEISYNLKAKTYHPHIHCIFEVRPSYFGNNYIKQSQWVSLWQKVMKLDYEPLLKIKAIKDNSAFSVAEVAKYPVKLNGIFEIKDRNEQARVLITLKRALHHRRLLTFGGDFREVKRLLKLKDVETDSDLIRINDKELNVIAYTLFRYRADFGCYIC